MSYNLGKFNYMNLPKLYTPLTEFNVDDTLSHDYDNVHDYKEYLPYNQIIAHSFYGGLPWHNAHKVFLPHFD